MFGRNKSSKGRPNISGPTEVTINHGPSSLLDTIQNSNTPPSAPPLPNRLTSSHSFSSLISFRSNSNVSKRSLPKTENQDSSSSSSSNNNSNIHLLELPDDESDSNFPPPVIGRRPTGSASSVRRGSVSSLDQKNSSVTPNHKVIDSVEAVQNYGSDTSHTLTFQKGDTIRVLLKLDSGWWDGLNPHGHRGWFPSACVKPLAPKGGLTTTQQPAQIPKAANSNNNNPTQDTSPSPDDPLSPLQHVSKITTKENMYQQQQQQHKIPSLQYQFSSRPTASTSPTTPATSTTRFDPSDPLAPANPTAHQPLFTQSRRSNNNTLANAVNPVFNNVFDNDNESIASAKTGENSRKGSIVSFMSSITPSQGGSDPSLIDPAASDFKYVDCVAEPAADLNSDLTSHWVPQASKSGKLYFVNQALKTFTPSLPFESVSPEAAASLAETGLPKQFDPPADITGLALLHEHTTKASPADNSTNFVLSRSADPYMDLVCAFNLPFIIYSNLLAQKTSKASTCSATILSTQLVCFP